MSEPQRWSLRRRVMGPFIAACALFWLASAALGIAIGERMDVSDADDNLRRAGELLLSFLHHEYRENAGVLSAMDDDGEFPFKGYLVQVWSPDSRLLLRSPEAPDQRIGVPTEAGADIRLDSGRWHVVSLFSDSDSLSLVIGEKLDIRHHNRVALALAMLVPALVGLPLVGLMAWTLADRALRPVNLAARAVALRRGNDLRPISSGEMPEEIQPLVNAFNAVLRRLTEAFDHERRFAANVAHELRTPLASIRINAQFALQQRPAPAAADAGRDIIESVVRADQVIEQLLAIARLESAGLTPAALDLSRITNETLREFADRIAARGLLIDAVIDPRQGPGYPQAAYIVLRNLLDNAVRHCAEGGLIRILAGHDDEGWTIQVDDAGQGSPGAASDDLQAGASGARIGLDLVRRIAALLRADFRLERSADLGGMRARFRVPHAQ